MSIPNLGNNKTKIVWEENELGMTIWNKLESRNLARKRKQLMEANGNGIRGTLEGIVQISQNLKKMRIGLKAENGERIKNELKRI